MKYKLIINTFKITSAFLFLLLLLNMIVFFNVFNITLIKDIQPIFGIVWAFFGSIWAVLGILSIIKQEEQNKTNEIVNLENLIKEPDDFINRIDDINSILSLISQSIDMSIYGQKGVGKSELLKYIHDIINGSLVVSKLSNATINLLKNTPKKSVYIDLVDSSGWDNAFLQLSLYLTGKDTYKDSTQVFSHLNQSWGKIQYVIIIDNVNNIAISQKLITFIDKFKNYRPNDIFIVGSIQKFMNPIHNTYPLSIKPFNDNHCREFLLSKDLDVSNSDLEYILNKSMGLPLFLNLLSFYDIKVHENSTMNEYFIKDFFDRLDKDEQELITFLSLCNLYVTTIKVVSLSISKFSNLNSKVNKLNNLSLLINTDINNSNEIKVHDLFRDIILEYQKEHIHQISREAGTFFEKINTNATICFYLISSDNTKLSFIKKGLEKQYNSKNHAFFISCWENSIKWSNHLSLFNSYEYLKSDILYYYINALLATGSYYKAEELISNTIIYEIQSIRPMDIHNKQEFNYLYSLIDLDHLLNRYTIAKENIHLLYQKSLELKWYDEAGKALWLYAHLLGHIGNNFKKVLIEYDECIRLAQLTNNTLLKLKSENGKIAINYTMGNIEYTTKEDIINLITIAKELDGNASILSSLYKNLARYYKLKNDFITAKSYLDTAIEIAQNQGLRTIINRDYDKAELLRFQEQYTDAIKYYNNVLSATEVNGDKNLYTSALLCICICDLYNSTLYYFDSIESIEKAILTIINISEELDMFITKIRAELVLSFVWDKMNISSSNLNNIKDTLCKYNLSRDLNLIQTYNISKLEVHIH